MAGPIVFISHHRIKQGKAESLTALVPEIWATLEAEKPRTLLDLAYVNDDETEIAFMHAFADIEAMQLHWQGADDRAQAAYQYIEPIGFEIYGDAGDQIVEGMRSEAAAAGATLTLVPEYLAGFLRLASA
jgi:quinol monooxygenase YgiN